MTNKTTIEMAVTINGKKYTSTHVFSEGVGQFKTKNEMVDMALEGFSNKVKNELSKEENINEEGF